MSASVSNTHSQQAMLSTSNNYRWSKKTTGLNGLTIEDNIE